VTYRANVERTVAGLSVVEWPGGAPNVVALAGLSGTAWAWAPVAEAVPEARLVAIDLRGRGRSSGLTGPTGLRAHARDVASVVRELGLTDVVVVGHSMGAFLAPVVAQELGAGVARIVCVDGGIRPKFPFFLGPRLTRLTFKRQLGKIDKTYPTVEAFAERSRLGTALAGHPELMPMAMRMLEHELGGKPGSLRPRLDVPRAVSDAVDTFFGPDVPAAVDALRVPADVLLAEHRMKPKDKPFIADAAAGEWVARQPLLRVHRLPGNHVTIMFRPELVSAIRGTLWPGILSS